MDKYDDRDKNIMRVGAAFYAVVALLGLVGTLAVAAPRGLQYTTLKASAVLLPDLQWHVTRDGGVRLQDHEACFDEVLGEGYLRETCCSQANLLGWRR